MIDTDKYEIKDDECQCHRYTTALSPPNCWSLYTCRYCRTLGKPDGLGYGVMEE